MPQRNDDQAAEATQHADMTMPPKDEFIGIEGERFAGVRVMIYGPDAGPKAKSEKGRRS